MNRWIVLFYLFTESYFIAAGVISWIMFSLRNGQQNVFVKVLATIFATIFFNGCCELVSFAFGYLVKPVYTDGYLISFGIGRVVKTIGMWIGVCYFIGYRKKH